MSNGRNMGEEEEDDSRLLSGACMHDGRLAVGCEERLAPRGLFVTEGDQKEANSQITRTTEVKEIRKMG